MLADLIRWVIKRPGSISSVRSGRSGWMTSSPSKAVPENDHVVAFTGLAPGRSRLTVETTDGGANSWGLVAVVREPHEVRIYQTVQINRQTGERRSDSSSAIGGYVALSCNEIRCDELEPTLPLKAPK